MAFFGGVMDAIEKPFNGIAHGAEGIYNDAKAGLNKLLDFADRNNPFNPQNLLLVGGVLLGALYLLPRVLETEAVKEGVKKV